MQKVMISKEEAVALESALEVVNGSNVDVISWHCQNLWDEERSPLNDVDLNTVCTALYVGYEVEPGPVEKIAQHYKETEEFHKEFYTCKDGGFYAGKMEGIQIALDLFNIKVSGINC